MLLQDNSGARQGGRQESDARHGMPLSRLLQCTFIHAAEARDRNSGDSVEEHHRQQASRAWRDNGDADMPQPDILSQWQGGLREASLRRIQSPSVWDCWWRVCFLICPGRDVGEGLSPEVDPWATIRSMHPLLFLAQHLSCETRLFHRDKQFAILNNQLA